jgi:hypothetical protein
LARGSGPATGLSPIATFDILVMAVTARCGVGRHVGAVKRNHGCRLQAPQTEETIMGKNQIAWFAGAVLAVLLVVPASAYEPTAQQRSDCMGDTMRYCMSEFPNTSGIINCLSRNKSKISPRCRVHFDRAGR